MIKRTIGIIGLGTVGSACKFGFEKLGHTVLWHDTKVKESKIENVLKASIVFICVPTPTEETSGACDISIVESVIKRLQELDYKGIIALKSTAEPGTTSSLKRKYSLNIVFIPEFLRERCAVADFVENHLLLAVGTDSEEDFNFIKDLHGNYPKKTIQLGFTEAELLKYYSNSFNALRVIFANEFFETCNALGASYDDVKGAFIEMGTVQDVYLDVNENFRGYGGVCLPKDVKAMVALQQRLGVDVGLLACVDKENSKYKTTVPEGMRIK